MKRFILSSLLWASIILVAFPGCSSDTGELRVRIVGTSDYTTYIGIFSIDNTATPIFTKDLGFSDNFKTELLPGNYKVTIGTTDYENYPASIGCQIRKGETINLTYNLTSGKLVNDDD